MAIKANELRIGCWIMFHPWGKGKRPLQEKSVRVKEIKEKTVIIIDPIGLDVELFLDTPQAQGIPLSGEVLEACGFESDSDGKWYVFPNTGIGVFYDLQQVCIGQFLLEELVLSSFHQLQNLIFSLTGKELIYNPSK